MQYADVLKELAVADAAIANAVIADVAIANVDVVIADVVIADVPQRTRGLGAVGGGGGRWRTLGRHSRRRRAPHAATSALPGRCGRSGYL